MKADEIITKAESFALSFKAKLSDKTEQAEKKQVFLMDNQEILHKYLDALQKIVSTSEESDDESSEDIATLVKRAEEITKMLKETLTNYQAELLISTNASEETTTAVLTQESIKEAMKTNKTTQEISANMAAIAEEQALPSISKYTHMLVCDGQSYFVFAVDKISLETQINSITDNKNFTDIQLFELHLKPVLLHKKTVLSL